jgi:hypothetical protein
MSKRTAPDDPAGPEDEDDEEFPSDEVLLRPRTRQHVLAEVDGELALLPTELQLIITYRLAIRPTMRLAMSNRTLMFLVDHAFVTLFKRDVLAQIGDNKPPDFYGDNPISNLFKLTRPRADLLPMPRTEPERAGRQKLELARVYKAVFEQLALIMADKIGTTLEFVFMNMTIGKRDVSITFFDPTDEDGEEESSFEVYIRAATSIGLVHSHTAKPELIQLARRVYEFVPKVRDYIQEDPLQERPPSPELMGILQSLFFEISPFYQVKIELHGHRTFDFWIGLAVDGIIQRRSPRETTFRRYYAGY